MVVRRIRVHSLPHETGSTGFTVDIYNLATKTREKRFGLKGESYTSVVAWPGKRIFMANCVSAGPGCTPWLVDLETEKTTTPGSINAWGVDAPLQRVDGSSVFEFVDSTGGGIAFADVDTGAKKGEIKVPIASDVENGVAVTRREGSEVAILAGAPQLGRVQLVDLATRKAGKSFTPPRCK